MANEEPLARLENLGDETRQILRIENTVHRPTHYWTPAVHALLAYLESVHFPYAPRVLGFDDEGREILSFIEGESGGDSWTKITTDAGLQRFAALLRAYHDAIAGFRPGDTTQWAYATGAPQSGEIMCHGDFGPWNVVWQGTEPVGIIDWDLVAPAQPEHDILYALEYSAPFRDDEAARDWHHFESVPERKHRIALFLEAYGAPAIDNIAAKVARMQRQVGSYVQYLAERGLQPQADWVAEGALNDVEQRARWTEENKQLFE